MTNKTKHRTTELFSLPGTAYQCALASVDDTTQVFADTIDVAPVPVPGHPAYTYIPWGEDDQLPYDVIDRIGQFLTIADGSGVDLCHENEKGIYGEIASRCLELHQALPGLKGVFDPANYVQAGQDTWEGWLMLAPYIKYLHIKDALATGHVVPSGHGIGNVAKIAAAFAAQGGQAVSIEPHLTVFDGLSKLEENGDVSKIGTYVYASADAAFDAACNAFKNLL